MVITAEHYTNFVTFPQCANWQRLHQKLAFQEID